MKKILLPLIALLMLVGCKTAQMTPPAGFVAVDEVRRGNYDYRAVSADGVVVAVRTEENSRGGDLEFWAKATLNQLQQQGYKLVNDEGVTSAAGTKGMLLEFTQKRSGTDYAYIVAVFVRPDRVIVPEAGGKSEMVEPVRPEVVKSLLSAR
jgi:hypothetical protein